MMRKFLDALAGAAGAGGAAPAAAIRPELATAALLIHAARRDGEYHPDEQTMIDHVLADAFSLAPAAAEALRAEAEAADSEAADVVRFTRALKDALDETERELFLERVWRVVLADGVRDDEENAFMRQLAGLLYVPDARSNVARRRAARPLDEA